MHSLKREAAAVYQYPNTETQSSPKSINIMETDTQHFPHLLHSVNSQFTCMHTNFKSPQKHDPTVSAEPTYIGRPFFCLFVY